MKKYSRFFWPITACALTLLALWPSLSCGFVDWDDSEYLLANPHLLELSWRTVGRILTDFHSDYYMPLSYLTYAVEHHFVGWNPFYFHATNLLFHLANVALVYWLIRTLGARPIVAFAVSALFGVHPQHVESVVWIMERKDVLFAFFFLLGLIIYCKKSADQSARLVTLLLFFISLLAKPTAVSLPFVLVAVDYFRGIPLKKAVTDKAPFFILVATWVLITACFKPSLLSSTSGKGSSVLMALPDLADALLFYVTKFLIPTKLSILYALKGRYFFYAKTWIVVASILVLASLVFFWMKRRAAAAWGITFFLLTLLPALVIVLSLKTVADRNMYLPSIGLLYAAADTAVFFGVQSRIFRIIAIASLVCTLTFFSFLSWRRCQVWIDSLTLWSDVASKNPNSKVARLYEGKAYMDSGKISEAIADFRRALKIPGPAKYQAEIYNYLGIIRNETKVYTAAERLYQKSLELDPFYARVCNNLGNNFESQGKGKEAFQMYCRALKIDPWLGMAYFNLADWHLRRGYLREAVSLYQKGMKCSPPDRLVYLALAHAYSGIGNKDEARVALQKAARFQDLP